MTRDYVTTYHGTCSANVPSIMHEGIKPRHGHGADLWTKRNGLHVSRTNGRKDPNPPSVYVTTSLEAASGFAKINSEINDSAPVVLTLHIPKPVFRKRFVSDEQSLSEVEAFRTTRTIPPDWIIGVRKPTATRGVIVG